MFFIYVTYYKMHDHFIKDSNRFNDFFNLSLNTILKINKTYVNNHSDTFISQAITYEEFELNISLCYSIDLNKNFYVRIYDIVP